MAEPKPDQLPSNPLPRVQFQKPEKRFKYKMSPLMGAVRAVFMLVFLLLIAAAVFLGAYLAWEYVIGKDPMERFKQEPSPRLKFEAQKKAVEPDWNARHKYWLGYFRDVFSPPPTNSWVDVGLATGIREKGLLVQVTDDMVVLKKDGQELGFPKAVLDNTTRSLFFSDDYALSGAGAKVEAEKVEWRRQVGPASGVATSPASPRSFMDIKCPACGGMGYYMVSGGGGQTGAKDGFSIGGVKKALAGSSLSPSGKEPCPVCGARGYRRFDKAPEFPWPAGASRCGKCQGMGMVWSRVEQGMKKGSITASLCPTCNYRGYVVNKWDTDHNVPPRYD